MSSVVCQNSFSVGLNKGFLVTKIKDINRPVDRKRRTSNRVRNIRKLIKGVVGYTSFEKKVIEMNKTGVNKVVKRAFKMVKKRLGSHQRAKKRQEKVVHLIKELSKKN